jgi:SAM-dependent methyltransferase
VEYDCSPKDLDRLFAHIKQVWSQLGEVEPHFSVFSVPSFKPANLAGNLQSFHQSGKGEVELLQAELDAHGLKSSGYRHCVELGCGVGRVTRFLSETSKRVTGLDISAPHLAIARESLDKEGITNVALKQVAEPATVSFPACDLFYSRIVLQHNPPPVMLFLIRKFLSALEPGGVAVFQVPTSIDGYSFKIEEYLTRMDKLDNQELHALPKKAIFATLAEAGCDVLNDYRDNSLPNIAHVSTRFVVRKRQVGQSTPATVRS